MWKTLLAFVILTTGFTACKPLRKKVAPAKSAEHQVRVTVGSLMKHHFMRSIPIQGTVEPVQFATLAAKTNGTLEAMRVNEGDCMKKGDVLFEIDRTILENQVQGQESAVQLQLAKIESAKIALDAAQINLQHAKNDYDRSVSLRKQNVISQATYDQDETVYKKAVNAVQLSMVEIRHAEAQLQEEENQLKIARKNLQDAVALAPFDCVVTDRYVEENEYVNTGKSILRLENQNALEVVCHISARYYGEIIPGKTRVILSAAGKQQEEAVVTYKSPSIHSNTRTVKLKIAVPQGVALVSGMLCDLRVILEEHDGWGLPSEALLLRANDRYIAYTVGEGNLARSVEIRRGASDEHFTEILNAEEVKDCSFVLTGQTFINSGTKLRVIAP